MKVGELKEKLKDVPDDFDVDIEQEYNKFSGGGHCWIKEVEILTDVKSVQVTIT